MCLHNIDRVPLRKWGVGYKLVEKKPDGSYVCYDHEAHAGTVTYPLREWVTDPNGGQATGFDAPDYKAGFHISLDKEALEKLMSPPRARYPMIKVKFRKVTATNIKRPDLTYGRQVVAREIMNLGEVD